MKKILYLSVALLLHLSHLNSMESSLSPIIHTSMWIGGAVVETATLLSKNICNTIYGNKSLQSGIEKDLRSDISKLKLDQPADIKQSRSLWPFIAGSVYANHDTLFISTDALKQLQDNKLDSKHKKALITALLMISSQYDSKVLATFIATPIALWTAIHYLNKLLQKNTFEENSWLNRVKSIIEKCEKSFEAKVNISAIIICSFMLYQYYLVSSQAKALLAH